MKAHATHFIIIYHVTVMLRFHVCLSVFSELTVISQTFEPQPRPFKREEVPVVHTLTRPEVGKVDGIVLAFAENYGFQR